MEKEGERLSRMMFRFRAHVTGRMGVPYSGRKDTEGGQV